MEHPAPGDLPLQLAAIGASFHARGWALGTSGNFSALVRRDPLRLMITSKGADKGALGEEHVLQVDEHGQRVTGTLEPSDETALHLMLVRARGARAVLHTHSVWSTLLSNHYARERGIALGGYEMLKGLEGVSTHEHREWLPIVENSQDVPALARSVEALLREHRGAHGFLIRRHGLYAWGSDLAAARRHVEIFEFLLEVLGRSLTLDAATGSARDGDR